MFNRQLKCSSLVTLALLLALITALVPSPGNNALAQDGDSYTFESNDKMLEWSSPWTNDEDNNSNDSGVESVVLSSDIAVLLVGTIPNELDLEEGRDLILDEFAKGLDDYFTVDRSAYDNFSYSLDQGTIEGAEFGIFTLFRGGKGDNPTEILVFLGLVEAFVSGFESAQTDIQLDGAKLFKGVDGAGLEAQLGGGGTSAENPDKDTPESDTSRDGGGDVLGDVKGGGSTDKETPAPDADKAQADDTGYLSTVEDQYGEWSDDFVRLVDILSNESLDDDAIVEELTGILNEFADAPDVAAELDVPSKYRELQSAYEDYANALSEIPLTFGVFLETEQGTAASDAALQDFSDALSNAANLGADLEAAIADA